jgi:hypothetical protein
MRLQTRSSIATSARVTGIALLTLAAVACGDAEPSEPPAAVCGAVPEGLILPIQTTESMPMHWPVADGCIRVTYDPAVAGHLEAFTAALDAWQGIPCSSLCFDEPVASDEIPAFDPDAPTLHIAPTETLRPESPDISGSTLTYVQKTGQILTAYIGVEDPLLLVRQAAWSHYVGFALGLGFAKPGVDSRMSADYDLLGPVTPTAVDEESFCVLYGDPPLCTP